MQLQDGRMAPVAGHCHCCPHKLGRFVEWVTRSRGCRSCGGGKIGYTRSNRRVTSVRCRKPVSRGSRRTCATRQAADVSAMESAMWRGGLSRCVPKPRNRQAAQIFRVCIFYREAAATAMRSDRRYNGNRMGRDRVNTANAASGTVMPHTAQAIAIGKPQRDVDFVRHADRSTKSQRIDALVRRA
ncbi:hypothetical protein [Burkholderia pyrrocinia]|uniref:hypothetical protein n=1 Tax=Burkholderia pyrrocinia TaxID=60550 RepID=UPI002AB07E99|nr:hypothetical protein [Burkholderia pyrrocinia]